MKAICFDMFFTLVDPHCQYEHLESDPTGMDTDSWNKLVWGTGIGDERGIGVYKSAEELMDRICELLPVKLTEEQKKASFEGKKYRMHEALCDIDPQILDTVKELKRRGYKIGLISNADPFDSMYWEESPLHEYFDDAIFSWEVELLKPTADIYELSLKRLGVKAEDAAFVGDGGSSEHKGAKAVGMTTVWTEYLHSWGMADRQRIANSADHHIMEFKELLDIFPEL